MIDPKEHEYHDDPTQGHPDARTRLAGACYYFLGNGALQAAIQVAPEGEGSPYGLLIQDPDRLTAKRDALTFDPETGLEPTMLTLVFGCGAECRPATVVATWARAQGIPAVDVSWGTGGIAVAERFLCPDAQPALSREVRIVNRGPEAVEVTLRTGVGRDAVEVPASLKPAQAFDCCLRYVVVAAAAAGGLSRPRIRVERVAGTARDPAVVARAAEQATVETGDALLDHLYRTAADQLSATISAGGRVDASIWQYTREWVRDHAWMAYGLLLSGHHAHARRMLSRLLTEFITDTGSALDASESREADEAELDQNGILLLVLHEYLLWTNDDSLLRSQWTKVTSLAEFPLSPVFRHRESGLLANRRDFWERHAIHGIEPGLELAHQVFVALGLQAAAALARRVGEEARANRWAAEASRLRQSALGGSPFGFVVDGRLVKRRGLDGRIQEFVRPMPGTALPGGVGLAADVPHPLHPDSVVALPVAWEFLDPRSSVAAATMREVETLWNQRWETGGYARMHVDSDADAPGAWPFVGAYVARAYLEMGRDADVWRILRWLGRGPGGPSGAWFELHGPRVSPPYAQVGIIPWAWAELLMLFVRHLLGVRPQADGLRLRPRLLSGLAGASAELPLRRGRLRVEVRRDPGCRAPELRAETPVLRAGGEDFVVAYPRGDCAVEIRLPERP